MRQITGNGRTQTGSLRQTFLVTLSVLVLLTCLQPVSTSAAGFKKRSISSDAVSETAAVKNISAAGKKTGSAFAKAMANTSVRLLQGTLAAKGTGKNILISPDSILTAVNIVGNGAKGATRKELTKMLGGITPAEYNQYLYTLHKRITGSKPGTYKIANSIWYRKGKIRIKNAYLRKIVSYYGADVFAAPFNSRTVKDINNWVYNHTKGMIPSIVDGLNPLDMAVVVNTVYFKGKWAEPYTGTVKGTFTRENGTKQEVDMLDGKESIYVSVNGADGFVKGYEGGKIAFMGLLPPEGTSLGDYIRTLTGEDLINGYKKRTSGNIDVYTRMPEFSFDCEVTLEKVLQSMGVKRIFTSRAELDKMSDTKLHIDQILHKTRIEVDKNGTKAAAATAILMKATAFLGERTVKKVYLDRPFVCALIDTKTGLPLFIGAVCEI